MTYHTIHDDSAGKSVSLTENGSILAVGGVSDTFGFEPTLNRESGYDDIFIGRGAVWIFRYNGSIFVPQGMKLSGNDSKGEYPLQGIVM